MRVYLETERLIIRDPIIEDFDVIWQMRNDEAVTKFTGGLTKLTREEAYKRHLLRCADLDSRPKEYAVTLKENNTYIGYCGFQHCQLLGGIELLYGLASSFWGQGYGVEAAKAVLDFGMCDLKLNMILAAVNYDNKASDKILEAIGLTYVEDIDWPDQGKVKKYELYASDYIKKG
jgi:RimJ/RimL family protein N-acetyltransferase